MSNSDEVRDSLFFCFNFFFLIEIQETQWLVQTFFKTLSRFVLRRSGLPNSIETLLRNRYLIARLDLNKMHRWKFGKKAVRAIHACITGDRIKGYLLEPRHAAQRRTACWCCFSRALTSKRRHTRDVCFPLTTYLNFPLNIIIFVWVPLLFFLSMFFLFLLLSCAKSRIKFNLPRKRQKFIGKVFLERATIKGKTLEKYIIVAVIKFYFRTESFNTGNAVTNAVREREEEIR